MQRQHLDPPGLFDSRQYGFSQAVLVEGGRRLHLSGQVATDAQERTRERGLAGHLEVALDNIKPLLRDAGTDLQVVTMLRSPWRSACRGWRAQGHRVRSRTNRRVLSDACPRPRTARTA